MAGSRRTSLVSDAVCVVVLFAAFFLLFAEGGVTNSDGLATYHLTESIVRHHSLEVAPVDGGVEVGRNGRRSIRYGPGLSVVSIPAYVGGRIAGRIVGHQDEAAAAAVSLVMQIGRAHV